MRTSVYGIQEYLAHKKRHPPQDHHMTLVIVLLYGPWKFLIFVSEVPLYSMDTVSCNLNRRWALPAGRGAVRFQAKRGQQLSPKSQGHNLTVTVLSVPPSLDSVERGEEGVVRTKSVGW